MQLHDHYWPVEAGVRSEASCGVFLTVLLIILLVLIIIIFFARSSCVGS